MFRFTTFGSTVVKSYPEDNPFDIRPPLWNLSPFPLPSERYDTPALREAACAAAQSSGVNPFYGSHGTCPVAICDTELDDVELAPFATYTTPPPLPRAIPSEPLVFLEAVNPTGNTLSFKVRVGDNIRLLKVFRDREVSMDGYRKPEERPPHPLKRFAKEREAYEHLLHYGACEKGAVPHCFGWLDLTEEDRDNLMKLPGLPLMWNYLHNDDGLPKALLLEYFDKAECLTINNITLEASDAAVRALYHVHASYVLHNDVHGRNVLLLPGGRIVWIDFDASVTVNRSTEHWPVRRQELLGEFADAWGMFYNTLLMDRRIGFRHWLY